MSKKVVDAFQPKITRNDRFAQMSHQEKVIEQKKKEIQLKLEAKQKANAEGKTNSGSSSGSGTSSSNSNNNTSKPTKSSPKIQDVKKSSGFNIFSNDGSFLDQFKQLKDKKSESKLKSFKSNDKDERGNRSSRWITKRRSSSPKERTQKLPRVSRFSDKSPTFEPKITINTSFNTAILSTAHQNFESQSLMTHNVTGQPLMKNLISPPSLVVFPTVNQSNNSDPVITAPPVLLNVPPPQIVTNTLVLPAPNAQNVNIIQSQAVLSAVTIPPPAIIPQAVQTVELSAIPPPNPIQVQNIPQPEPINALNIPPPAPIQVQNIPTPSSIQLNEIPNPQPLDLLAIPTPQDDKNGGTITDSDFIKNVPPPNKSVPPPNLTDSSGGSTVIQLSTNLGGTLVHNLPPPPPQTQINLTNQGNFAAVTVVANPIPSLMAQPILPPPGMGMTNVNVNCPPPLLSLNSNNNSGLQPPPPPFVRQLPPINTNQMPSMSVPPPTGLNILVSGGTFKDLNSGTPDYEAMASLARMVAQCGSSFEEVVRQRKNQDPSHWFLFHKESSAYQQYLQLVDQFKLELEQEEMKIENKYKPEEIYEPEMVTDDFDLNSRSLEINQETNELPDIMNNKQRKRRSRWGDKDPNIPPPTAVVMYNNSQNDVTIPVVNHSTPIQGGPVMLSRVSRTDPALIQYALNTFGSTNLTEDEWKKAEDHYKINLLYQDMVRKREEVERLKLAGKNKYDYDSDEETDGGTWEHRLREKEMMATQLWAQELTRQAEGKHHIGDFLPPEEMKRFMEKSSAAKEGRQPNFSDYKEFKIKEDNIGFKMLQKLGWSEGEGLGSSGGGIVEPVNKAANRDHNQGLGLNETEESEDEYESYRKRMMLAYRFRPNPLNNPRRPYY